MRRTLQQLDFTGSNISVSLCKKKLKLPFKRFCSSGNVACAARIDSLIFQETVNASLWIGAVFRTMNRSCAASTWQLVHGSPCENAWAQSRDAPGTNKRHKAGKPTRTSNKNTDRKILTIDRKMTHCCFSTGNTLITSRWKCLWRVARAGGESEPELRWQRPLRCLHPARDSNSSTVWARSDVAGRPVYPEAVHAGVLLVAPVR